MPFIFFVSTVAMYGAGYTLLPTLPLILQNRGASPAEVGLIMGAYTASSLLCRGPLASSLARRPPEPFLRGGHVILAVAFLAYLLPGTLLPLLAGRVLQGIGFAFFNTAAYVYLAEKAGPGRRAQFVSLFGLSANVAMGLAPVAGSVLLDRAGATWLFAAGTALAVGGLLTVPRTRLLPAGGGPVRLWEPDAWPPTAAMLGFALAYGSVMVFVPLAIAGAGLSQGWLFFTGYSLSVVTTRLSTHRLIDRGRRLWWGFGGNGAIAAALLLLAFASTWPAFLSAALLFGVGVGTAHPSVMAYILEAVPAERRSVAAAMGAAAFDAGTASGAAVAGWIATYLSYSAAFVSSAGLLALLLLPLAQQAARRQRLR